MTGTRKSARGGAAVGKAVAGGAAPGLGPDRLVEAAIGVLQESGLDGLSTRRVADRLGVKSPALYWHVSSKEALLAMVADTICAHMKLPRKGISYRKRLEAIAREYRRVLLAYRDAPRLFAGLPPTGPHRMRLYEAAVGAFREAGFPAPEAVAMATSFRYFLLGLVSEEARQLRATDSGRLRPTDALQRELARLGEAGGRYPNLQEASGSLVKMDAERLFRMSLSILLDGVDQHVAARQRKPA